MLRNCDEVLAMPKVRAFVDFMVAELNLNT